MMMNSSQRSALRTHGVMAGRMLLGLLFVWTGVGILLGGVENTAGFMTSLGVPMAGVLVYAVVAVKVLAGGALMLGYRTGLAAGALIGFTALTILLAHLDTNDVNLWKNLAIIGGLLYAMAYGPGEGWKLRM